MQIETFQARRTPEGAIDVQHYVRAAHTERRMAKSAAMRGIAHGAKRAIIVVAGFLLFWNIPPMGSAGSKDMPYR